MKGQEGLGMRTQVQNTQTYTHTLPYLQGHVFLVFLDGFDGDAVYLRHVRHQLVVVQLSDSVQAFKRGHADADVGRLGALADNLRSPVR